MQPLSQDETVLLHRLSKEGYLIRYFDTAKDGGAHEELIARGYAHKIGGHLLASEVGYQALFDVKTAPNTGATHEASQ